MMKSVSELVNGEMFLYRDYLYKATDERREETSQRLCRQIAFKMDGEWHFNSGEDWFNQYCDVHLVKIDVVLI